MRWSTDRITALGVATLLAAPSGTLGTLTMTPATGLDLSTPDLVTTAGCSEDADGYNVIVTGPGAFAEGFPVVATNQFGFSTTGPIGAGFNINLRDAATLLQTTIVPGEYVVTFNCMDTSTFEVKGTFVGSMYFTTPTNYQTTDPDAPPTTTTPNAAGSEGSADGAGPGLVPPGGGAVTGDAAAPGAGDAPAESSSSQAGSNGPGNGFPSPLAMAGIALGGVVILGAVLAYLLRGRPRPRGATRTTLPAEETSTSRQG